MTVKDTIVILALSVGALLLLFILVDFVLGLSSYLWMKRLSTAGLLKLTNQSCDRACQHLTSYLGFYVCEYYDCSVQSRRRDIPMKCRACKMQLKRYGKVPHV